MKVYDFWVPLVRLDEKEAIFHNIQTGVTLAIPLHAWIRLNRPGHLRVPLTETF